MNRSIVSALLAIALSTAGCGVETASTAATAAALKQKELEAGKKTMSEAERKIGESMQLQQQGAQKAGEADKQ
jgi:NifU-like protein involved in Fe-S cluster formation